MADIFPLLCIISHLTFCSLKLPWLLIVQLLGVSLLPRWRMPHLVRICVRDPGCTCSYRWAQWVPTAGSWTSCGLTDSHSPISVASLLCLRHDPHIKNDFILQWRVRPRMRAKRWHLLWTASMVAWVRRTSEEARMKTSRAFCLLGNGCEYIH